MAGLILNSYDYRCPSAITIGNLWREKDLLLLGPGNYMAHLGPHSKVIVEGARNNAHKPGVEGGGALRFWKMKAHWSLKINSLRKTKLPLFSFYTFSVKADVAVIMVQKKALDFKSADLHCVLPLARDKTLWTEARHLILSLGTIIYKNEWVLSGDL